MEEQKLTLNADEAAKLLGISRGSVYLASERGELPVLRLGKRLLIPKKALEDLLTTANPIQRVKSGV